MHQDEVQVLRAEPLQALLVDTLDRRVATIELGRLRHGVRGDADFAHQDDVLAPGAQRAAKYFLGTTEAVIRRGIEERHTQVDGAVDGRDHLVVVAAAVLRIAHLPAAEPDGRNAETSVAELALLHLTTLAPSVRLGGQLLAVTGRCLSGTDGSWRRRAV